MPIYRVKLMIHHLLLRNFSLPNCQLFLEKYKPSFSQELEQVGFLGFHFVSL